MNFEGFYEEIYFNVDKKINKVLKAKQGDTGSRGLDITLLQKNLVLPVTTETMTAYFTKPDNTHEFIHAEKVDGKFRIDFTNQVVAVPGKVKCELTLYGSLLEQITGETFDIEVAKNLQDGSIESSNQFTALVEALNKVNDFDAQLAEKALQSDLEIEKARITNLATLTGGSTTGDAELIDGRIGEDGTVYDNLGQAIRTQVGKKADKTIIQSKLITFEVFEGQPRLRIKEV